MTDKGFNLKVLVPTDDGVRISKNKIQNAKYYLMYNLSNRSYQLAGKIKCAVLFKNADFDLKIFEEICIQNNIDQVVSEQEELDIGSFLNELIDEIDKKTS